MLSLKSIDNKFAITFEVIENGSGTFSGVIDEIVMNQMPSGLFLPPSRLMRVEAQLPVLSGMVVRSQAGAIYIVGEHGESEAFVGTVFKAFRLFPTHEKYEVTRKVTEDELVTGLPQTEEMVPVANIWGIYQPQAELFDRETRVSEEQAKFITNYALQRGDGVAGKRVFRVDRQLGLYIATLS